MFQYLTSRALLLVPLFALLLGAFAGPCMPCSTSNRRDTPWDQALARRGVWTPKITKPTNNTVWKPASEVMITWDVHGMPEKPSNPKGTLLLGYLEKGSDDEHLDIEHPLATNFDLERGFITIECPNVDPRENYIVVLFGDSGNRSPQFTIRN